MGKRRRKEEGECGVEPSQLTEGSRLKYLSETRGTSDLRVRRTNNARGEHLTRCGRGLKVSHGGRFLSLGGPAAPLNRFIKCRLKYSGWHRQPQEDWVPLPERAYTGADLASVTNAREHKAGLVYEVRSERSQNPFYSVCSTQCIHIRYGSPLNLAVGRLTAIYHAAQGGRQTRTALHETRRIWREMPKDFPRRILHPPFAAEKNGTGPNAVLDFTVLLPRERSFCVTEEKNLAPREAYIAENGPKAHL